MGRIEKTVFISYRRTNLPWALNIYHNLTAHGYDVFFDYETLPSGDFEQSILGNIRARAHFVVVLTPSALERCASPDDWLRREVETAIDEHRNIVPLFLEGFNFSSPSISSQLTGKLELLKNYNGLNIPSDYFNEAMERLRNRHLNVALDTVLHPVSDKVQKESQKQQAAASKAIEVNEKELSAQEWFEQAHKNWLEKNFDEAIRCATEAIFLKPDFAEAYSRRGTAKSGKGDLDGAIQDYTEAIRLKPDFPNPYHNRGISRKAKDDLDGAIKDYNEAIRLKPDDAESYNNRGNARKAKSDLDGAIKDYTEAIRLKPDYADAYYNRAIVWKQKEDYYAAIADYQKYLDLGGGIRDGDQEKIEGFIRDLKKKIK